MVQPGEDAASRREAIRLAEARRAAAHGIFERELESGHAYWTDEIYWLLGLQPGSFEPGAPSLLAGVVAEDREIVRGILAREAPGQMISFRFRSRWPDGSVHWLEAVGRVLPPDEVGPARAVGRLALADEQVAREAELEQTRLLAALAAGDLATLIESLPVAIQVTHDVEARSMQMNRAFAELFRLPRNADPSLSGPRAHELLFRFVRDGVAVAPSELIAERAAKRGERSENVEMELAFSDGERRWILGSAAPLLDPDGTPRGAVAGWVDITERKRLEAELRRALEAKDVFLGLVSHELKTPLTTILGLSQILSARINSLDAETREEAARSLATDAVRLQQIIENMLTLARAGAAPPELEPVLVHRLLERAVSAHLRIFPGGLITVVAKPCSPVLGQPTWIEQVIENFLSNAQKYAPQGSPVTAFCEESGGEVRVAVRDSGAGVDADELELIMLPFVRSAAVQTQPGVGLGLAVCKQLAANMGGRIEVRNLEGGGFEASLVLRAISE